MYNEVAARWRDTNYLIIPNTATKMPLALIATQTHFEQTLHGGGGGGGAESQKPRRRVGIADRKVFARPESFWAYLQNCP